MKKGAALSLPKGWEIKRLGDVCNFQNGFAFKSKTYKDEGTPVVRITNIQDEKLDLTKIVYIDPKNYNKDLSKYKIIKGDLLIAMSGATTGKIGIHKTDEELLLNQRVGKFEPKQTLDKTYLLNFLKTKVEESLAISAGAAQPNLSTEQIKGFETPLPPLPEQQRIVVILDKAFTAIATAKENAQQNLLNAKELFESYLQEVFDPSTRSGQEGDDWEEKKLSELTNKIGSGATPRGGKSSYKEVGMSLIRSMNVHDFEFREKNLALIDDEQANALSNVTLQENDILLNITGASIARCCIVPKQYLPARVNQHVSIIRAKKDIISPLFLGSLLTSKFYKDQILEIGEQGATRQAITKVQLENFKIVFPKSIKEQEKVIQEMNTLSTETKKLATIYQQKINDLEELKKSVLDKAFKGEL